MTWEDILKEDYPEHWTERQRSDQRAYDTRSESDREAGEKSKERKKTTPFVAGKKGWIIISPQTNKALSSTFTTYEEAKAHQVKFLSGGNVQNSGELREVEIIENFPYYKDNQQ